VLDTTTTPPLPVPLKLGDANLDGFPDLLMVAVSETDHRTPFLVSNVACTRGLPGCGERGDGRRGWSLVRNGASSLDEVEDAAGVAFLDMAEDVSLGLTSY
jgi:integrin alpha FG-GAP repeat containing protein 1